MNRLLKFLALGLLPLVLSACATTHLVSTWQSEEATSPLRKVLVIGISDNNADRRLFEDVLVQKLEAAGVQARASYLDLPDAKAISREAVEKLVKDSDFDSVLVTHYEGTNEELVYRPGTAAAYGYNDMGYWGYYSHVYGTVYTPGYYVNYKYVYLQTNIYSTRDGNVIWSARSETTNPRNIAKSFAELSDAIIKSLRSSGLIAGR